MSPRKPLGAGLSDGDIDIVILFLYKPITRLTGSSTHGPVQASATARSNSKVCIGVNTRPRLVMRGRCFTLGLIFIVCL